MNHKSVWTLVLPLILFGCARQYPELPWSADEKVVREELRNKLDPASRLELARMEFTHNHIADADRHLSDLLREYPNDMEVKAWHAANRCKMAETHGPWLLGMDKLVLVWSCLAELERAAHHAKDNLSVGLAELYAAADANLFGAGHRAIKARDRLMQLVMDKPDQFSAKDRVALYEASALLDAREGNFTSAHANLNRVIELNVDSDSVERAKKALAEGAVQHAK